MAVIFQQFFILYIFLLVGWTLGKWKVEQTAHIGVLSFLLVNIFLPCKVFNTFWQNVTVSYIRRNYNILLISSSILLVFVVIAKFLSKVMTKNPYERKIYRYSLTVSNYAYMGYALVEGIFGENALADLIFFCMPFAIYTYSFGYAMLTGGEKSYKKLWNPLVLAILLGMFGGLSGFQMPEMIKELLASSSACVGPISMLMTGLTLSTFPFKELVSDKMTYVFALLRLVVLPLTIFVLCKILQLTGVLTSAVVMAAMPCGLNTIVFPKLVGEDCKVGAQIALITHLFSCVTLPIWLSVLM